MEETELAGWGCVGMLLTIPTLAALRGWTMSILWGWFVVPIFHVDPLTIPRAMGLSVFAGIFYSSSFAQEDPKWASFGKKAIIWFVAPFLSLFTGWIVKQWL